MDIEKASIWKCLDSTERRFVRFVRPSPEHGLTVLNEKANQFSPATTVLSLRKLTLARNQAIPFHVHHEKEKAYVFDGGITVAVMMYEGDELKRFWLEYQGDTIVVPPRTVHAMACLTPAGKAIPVKYWSFHLPRTPATSLGNQEQKSCSKTRTCKADSPIFLHRGRPTGSPLFYLLNYLS